MEPPSESPSKTATPINTESPKPHQAANNTDGSDPMLYIPGLRRSTRSTAGKSPVSLQETNVVLMMKTVCSTSSKSMTRNFKQAVSGPKNVKRIEALNDKFESLDKMKTWRFVKLPKRQLEIRLKWIFDLKNDSMGEVERY